MYKVSEHRLIHYITRDNKLRWDSYIDNVCKTVSRRVFLLSKLKYIVGIDTRKLFFNDHIKPDIDYASVFIVQELCVCVCVCVCVCRGLVGA